MAASPAPNKLCLYSSPAPERMPADPDLAAPAGMFYGWYVVAAAFAILFAGFGCAYSFGAFFLPLAEAFAATRAEVSAVFSYAAALIFGSGAVSGLLADRCGPRRVVFLGIFGIIIGLVGSAHAQSLAGVTAYFTFGVGIGVGFIYVPALGTVQRWFARRRGFASGLAVTGIGLGTLVMPLLAGRLLEEMSWRSVFLVMAGLVALCCLPALICLEHDPARRGLNVDGDPAAPARAVVSAHEPGLAAIALSRPFFQLYAAQFVMSFVILLPFVHLVPAAMDMNIPRIQAVVLVALIGFGSTFGRIIIGGIADRLGRKPTQVCLFASLGACYLVWLSAQSFVMLVAFALAFGVLYGGLIALMPALIADYFAGPHLSSIIGLQYTSAAFGSLLGPIATGYIFDLHGSYIVALQVAALLCLLAAGVLAATPPPARIGGID